MPVISVIVPIYNVEFYLADCLDSILAQTLTDFELILVNDGSKDNCGEICDNYAKRDKRIKVIHRENAGVSSARNEGINRANGEYINFVDPDDTIEPKMYEVMYETAKKYNADMVVCPIKTHNLFTGTESISSVCNKVEGAFNKKDIEEHIIPSILEQRTFSLVSSINKLYKRSLVNGYDIRFEENKSHSEDARLNYKILPWLNSLVYVGTPLYNYYIRRKDSLTQAFREDLYEYIVDNKHFMLQICRTFNLESYIEKVRGHYAGVALFFLQDLIGSSLSLNKKFERLSTIINDEEFTKDLDHYRCPSNYTKLLKLVCKLKNEKLVFRIIQLKNRLQYPNNAN